MGLDQSKNINVHDTKINGIYIVDIKKYPDYPIAYFRLMHHAKSNKYCIPETCDIKNTFFGKRKILVIGMRLAGIEGIHEQSFYLSTGKNSIDSLRKILPVENNIYDEKDFDLWLPFTALGYNANDIKHSSWKTDSEDEIKLLKTFFDCTEPGPECKYGRFGNIDPNLMQVSYCLGGLVWNDVSKTVKDYYNLEELPNLHEYMSKIPCINISAEDNIKCSIKINKYIGNASFLNYCPDLIEIKNKILSKKILFTGIDFDINKIDFDWNIVYKLVEKEKMEFIVSNMTEFKKYYLELPDEYRFFLNLWTNYIFAIINLCKEDKEYFNKQVLPLIIDDETKKIFVNSVIEEFSKTEVKTVSFVLDPKKIGTKENPHVKKEDAKINQYYKVGKRVCRRHK